MNFEPGIHHLFEFLCLLAGLFFYRKLRNSFMIWFIPYLAVILSLEIFQNIYHATTGKSTKEYSEIAHLISISFFSFFFVRVTNRKKYKHVILLCTSLYVFFVLFLWNRFGLSYVLFGKLQVFHISIIIGGFLLSIFSCMLFYQYLQEDNSIAGEQMTSFLWVAAGILIFYSGIEIFISSMDYIKTHHMTIGKSPLYNAVPRLLSVPLYFCIAICFYKWKVHQK